jgi:hypothetical protein
MTVRRALYPLRIGYQNRSVGSPINYPFVVLSSMHMLCPVMSRHSSDDAKLS